MDSDVSGGSGDDSPHPGDGWAMMSGAAALEVRPIGGSDSVGALIAGQRYELYYTGASHSVEAYALLVSSASCDTPPISAVEPADSGDWAATGLFEFSAIEAASTPEGAEGSLRCGMGLDDQSASGWLAGTEGPLCTFTAGPSGALGLELWLTLVDEADQTTYESSASGSYLVND